MSITYLVAEENQKIIGVIMVGNDGRRGYIYHTAVNPVKRGKFNNLTIKFKS